MQFYTYKMPKKFYMQNRYQIGVQFFVHMTKQRWKNKIKKAAQAAGTYQPYFDTVIETLAGILETRDKAQ